MVKMIKLLLMILVLSTGLIAENTNVEPEKVTVLLSEFKTLYRVSKYWTRFTTDFSFFYSVKIETAIKNNIINMKYDIYRNDGKMLIYSDIIEIPVETKVRDPTFKIIIYGILCVGAGFITGTIIQKRVNKK